MKDAMPKGPSDKDVDAALVRLVREKAEYFAVNRSSVRVTLSPASVTVSWWGEAGDDAPGYRGDRGTDGRTYREDMAHRTQVHNSFLDEIRHALQRSPYGSAVDLVKSEWGVPQDGEFYEFRVVKKPRTASSLSTPSMPARATPLSKTLTASEQATLLRYASALPKGHETRRAIVAAVSKVAASDIKWKRLSAGKMQGWSYTDDDLVVQVLSVKKITTVKDKNVPSWSDVTNDGEMYADGIPELMEQAGRAEKDLAQWQRQGWWPKPVEVEAWKVFTTHRPTRTHMESVTDFDTSREALAKAEAAIPRLKARMRPSWLKVT